MPPLPLLLLCLSWALSDHDFHVSQLTLDENVAAGRYELTLHTFVDDVELAATLGTDIEAIDLNLLADNQHPLADSLVRAYLSETVRMSDTSALDIMGYEAADDPYAMYVYLVCEKLSPKPTAPRLVSSYLLDLYDDQQNIVVWKRGGETVDYDLLTASKREATRDE